MGIVIGAAVVASLIGSRVRFEAVIGVVIAGITSVLMLPGLWTQAAGLDSARAGLQVPPGARLEKCLHDRGSGAQTGMVWWARPQMGEGDTFAVDSEAVDRACFQLNMLPYLMVNRSQNPDWTVRVGSFSKALRRRIREERGRPREERTVFVLDRQNALIRNR